MERQCRLRNAPVDAKLRDFFRAREDSDACALHKADKDLLAVLPPQTDDPQWQVYLRWRDERDQALHDAEWWDHYQRVRCEALGERFHFVWHANAWPRRPMLRGASSMAAYAGSDRILHDHTYATFH